jgi:hypothetical protein
MIHTDSTATMECGGLPPLAGGGTAPGAQSARCLSTESLVSSSDGSSRRRWRAPSRAWSGVSAFRRAFIPCTPQGWNDAIGPV